MSQVECNESMWEDGRWKDKAGERGDKGWREGRGPCGLAKGVLLSIAN